MLFDRPAGKGERAVLVHIEFSSSIAQNPDEFLALVEAAGAQPVAWVGGQRSAPHARYYVGTGKVEEIANDVQNANADLVVFDHCLSPGQERNLEKEFKCRVVDRTGLILDIFAQRARTHEGKLQVELAQLQHMSTRLVRGWTHLERQKGGIGLRGPGETQLESDRRLLRDRIKYINKRLAKVSQQRQQIRRRRLKSEVPLLSLVGYTNAGKSTVFNTVTDSDVYAADQLFATLDPTLRRVDIAHFGEVIFADTVGFIRDLPHKLVEAFKATLEEVSNANLLIHVIDAADDLRDDNIGEVNAVLKEIKAHDIPVLEVYNKIDLMGISPRIDRDDTGKPRRVWLSAASNIGFDALSTALAELLAEDIVQVAVVLGPQHSRLRARFYQFSAVVSEQINDLNQIVLEIRMPRPDYLKLLSNENVDEAEIRPVSGNNDLCNSSGQ